MLFKLTRRKKSLLKRKVQAVFFFTGILGDKWGIVLDLRNDFQNYKFCFENKYSCATEVGGSRVPQKNNRNHTS